MRHFWGKAVNILYLNQIYILHLMTFDPCFDPLNGKILPGNTPSHIRHIKILQKMYVNRFSPKMPHAA